MDDQISIIIVDDEKDIVDNICTSLEHFNIKILGTGYDGKEAVELYKKLKPDVIILDVVMPEYDGLYALKHIKEFDSNAKILVVTANTSNTDIEKLNYMHINFLYKPFELEDIVENLRLLVEY